MAREPKRPSSSSSRAAPTSPVEHRWLVTMACTLGFKFRVDNTDDGSSNLRVPVCDHLDGICPARPMCGMSQFDCAPQTESSHGREVTCCFGRTRDGTSIRTHQCAQTAPDLRIMCWAANAWDKLGLTVRKKKFALEAAQNKRDQPGAL